MTFAVAAGISAAATLGGSLLSAGAARSAANTQAESAQRGIDAQTQAKQDQIAALTASLDKQLAAAAGVLTPEIKNAYDYLAQIKDSIAGYGANVSKTANDVLSGQLATYGDVYQQQQNWMNPVYQAGMGGQARLLNYLGIGAGDDSGNFGKYATADFTPEQFYANQDPGYGFRFSEGQKAVERQAAARNGLISGAALKASQRFGQDMASQEYQNAFNRYQTSRSNTLNPLQQLTGQGATAAGALGSYAGAYGSNVGNAYGRYGDIINSMYGNQTNMLNSALGTSTGLINNAYSNLGNLTGAAYGTYGNNLSGVYGSYGSNLANLYGAQGQANASGTVGAANALTGGLTNAGNAYMQGSLYNYLRPQGQGGGTATSAYAPVNMYDNNPMAA